MTLVNMLAVSANNESTLLPLASMIAPVVDIAALHYPYSLVYNPILSSYPLSYIRASFSIFLLALIRLCSAVTVSKSILVSPRV